MELALKYRIVGAAVLLSLAVIFVPLILDGSGQDKVTTLDLEIPPEPQLIFADEPDQPIEIAKETRQEVTKADLTPKVDLEKNIVPEITTPSDTPASLLSWVVQVGAFNEEEKAKALQQKLADAKYDAFVESHEIESKTVYRVKVGPVISQDKADKILEKLQKAYKFDTAFITRHPRVEH